MSGFSELRPWFSWLDPLLGGLSTDALWALTALLAVLGVLWILPTLRSDDADEVAAYTAAGAAGFLLSRLTEPARPALVRASEAAGQALMPAVGVALVVAGMLAWVVLDNAEAGGVQQQLAPAPVVSPRVAPKQEAPPAPEDTPPALEGEDTGVPAETAPRVVSEPSALQRLLEGE